MKTKHLLSAAMLTALFAACSNEELVTSTAPSVAKDGRPTVENVKLAFEKVGQTDTRVAFDPNTGTGTYSWEEGDAVGALLMDEIPATQANRPFNNPEEWAKLSWTEKYALSDYIHTDYPFAYKKADGTWTSNAAMLEGNYFFVSPYEGYNSRRQLIHSIAGQKQKDGSLDATAEAFGRNQYWIGYSQIKEGNKTSEALTTVEMTRVLAPIRFEIKMIGTQTYKVNKITIQGEDVRTLLTIDPTCGFNVPDGSTPSTTASAGYKGENGSGDYNLKDGSGNATTAFNYANYISQLNNGTWAADMKEEVYAHADPVTAANNQVFNIDDETNYDRFNALRAIVDVESVKTEEVQYAEMSYETEQTLKGGTIVNGVIFVNPDLEVETGKLSMSIYTDQGIIKDIDLTVVNSETDKAQGKTTVITDKKIEKLTPATSNTIKIQVDDNSIDVADYLKINNTNDLEQFINWNKGKNRPYVAALENNATLTKDMVETLRAAKKANVDNKFIVTTASGRKLTIAADAAADVFNFVCLDGVKFDTDHNGVQDNIASVDVEILGTVTLNSATAIALPDGTTPKQITVAKGATLNIEAANTSKLLIIENNGTIAMAATKSAKNVKVINNEKAEMTIAGQLEFATGSENSGTVNVSATGELQGTTTGNITNKGLIKNAGKIWNIVNADEETAIVETSALINHFKSNGAAATIKLTTLDDAVTGTTAPGHILYEGADVDLSDATAAGVTDLVVSGYLHVENDATAATVKTITVKEATTIEGGSYTSAKWTAGAQKLNVVAANAVINISTDVKMNHLNVTTKANVNVLKGSLSIDKGTVAAIEDLTLGSKEAFTEIGATVNVAKGATLTIAGTLARNAALTNVKPVINNNGTTSAQTKTDVTSENITVNGNDID